MGPTPLSLFALAASGAAGGIPMRSDPKFPEPTAARAAVLPAKAEPTSTLWS